MIFGNCLKWQNWQKYCVKERILILLVYLTKFGQGYVDEDVEKVPISRLISNNNQTIPAEAVHIYAENTPAYIYEN